MGAAGPGWPGGTWHVLAGEGSRVGPRGLPLMALLTVVAAGLLAATLWLWPVLARRGVAAVALRTGLLVALQASVLGVVFVSVNRTYEFYASWSDLLGTDHSVAQVIAARPGITHAVTAGRPSPVVTLASSPVMVPGARRDLVGRLAEVRFAGQVSGITATGHVYLPPGYSPDSRPLPVIVVISRQAGSGAASYGAQRIAAVAAAQIRAGRMAPAIIAVLSPAIAGRADQACLDSPGGPQAGTFFSQDLPQALTQAYHAVPGPAGWAVLGGAGGGYCALQLATASSGQFAVAAAAPGTYKVPPGRGETAAGSGLRRQDNLLWRLRNWPPPPVRVLFAGPGRSRQFTSLVRPPMTVVTTGPAAALEPLAPVLDWIGHALAAGS
jgi:Putative esterase